MWRDDAYMLDMLISSKRAISHLDQITWEQFKGSDLHQDAVIRALEVIGEAASQVSTQTREKHSDVPWPQIIGMRNRLIHEYFRADLEEIWSTVRNDIPQLMEQLSRIVPPDIPST